MPAWQRIQYLAVQPSDRNFRTVYGTFRGRSQGQDKKQDHIGQCRRCDPMRYCRISIVFLGVGKAEARCETPQFIVR
jgi:hypothetical protein